MKKRIFFITIFIHDSDSLSCAALPEKANIFKKDEKRNAISIYNKEIQKYMKKNR